MKTGQKIIQDEDKAGHQVGDGEKIAARQSLRSLSTAYLRSLLWIRRSGAALFGLLAGAVKKWSAPAPAQALALCLKKRNKQNLL